jgi:hypothetical protein
MDSSGASECKSFNLLEETEGFINLAVWNNTRSMHKKYFMKKCCLIT